MYNFRITDEPYAVGYLSVDTDSKHIRVGNAFVSMAKHLNLTICPETFLPYTNATTTKKNPMAVGHQYANGMFLNGYMLLDKAKDPELGADYQYIYDTMGSLVIGVPMSCAWTQTERDAMGTNAAYGGTWGGHGVPNIIDFAVYGTDGLRDKINRYKEMNMDVADFYDGLLLFLDAMDILGKRYGELASELAKTAEGDARRKYERMAKTFSYCPKAPAKTFADAVLVYTMIYILDGIDSPGHFDWYMIDFWNKSDYAESREALEDIWVLFHNTRSWNLCIGGSDENWNDKTNALTYEILDVARKFKFNTPNITMRCHRNTPEELLRAAAETIATGIGMPALYNDEAVCPALERLGICPADSHEYVMNGCNQIDIQGKSQMGLEDGEVNLGMAVELAFTNGVTRKEGKDIGAKTGDVSEFDTFEKFYDAVKTQIRHLCDIACGMSNKGQRLFAKHTVHLMRSITVKGCIEKGRDYKNGGPLYGHGQILGEGLPDAIDSVAAVKKYVYEDKLFTITELRDALAANFEGYDGIYKILRESKLRFGNDMDYVDEIAKDLVDYYNSYLLTKPTVRGGFFGGGCSPYTRAAEHGEAVGALPNGKREEEYLFGDSIGATPGYDVNGPTALLKSCLKFDHTLPTSGFILNIKFDRKLFGTEKGIEGFLSLYRAYFGNKAQQLSVTVVSREDLLDAVENPDAHRDLIVRVGGFSDYFVNLGRELQENVIARTDYEL